MFHFSVLLFRFFSPPKMLLKPFDVRYEHIFWYHYIYVQRVFQANLRVSLLRILAEIYCLGFHLACGCLKLSCGYLPVSQ